MSVSKATDSRRFKRSRLLIPSRTGSLGITPILDFPLQCSKIIALENGISIRLSLQELQHPKNPYFTNHSRSVDLIVIGPKGLVDMAFPAGWNVGDAKEPDKKERFEYTTGCAVIGDPPGALGFDVILGTTAYGVLVEVETPMEIVLLGRVTS
jgi:hypothetical protein